MRVRNPWFRKSKRAWFVEIDGKQVRLAVGEENKQAAFDAFYKLMAGGPSQQKTDDGLLVITICDLFLEYSANNHTAPSYKLYKHFLKNFCKLHPRLTVADLKPFYVTRWLDQRPQWKGGKWHAIASVKRAMSWAEQEGLIASSPIKHIRKPAMGRPERVVTPAEKQQILAAIKDQAFNEASSPIPIDTPLPPTPWSTASASSKSPSCSAIAAPP